MPVTKYRTTDDARKDLWSDPKNPKHWKEIAALWRLSSWLYPQKIVPGVRKDRTIEDAQQGRE